MLEQAKLPKGWPPTCAPAGMWLWCLLAAVLVGAAFSDRTLLEHTVLLGHAVAPFFARPEGALLTALVLLELVLLQHHGRQTLHYADQAGKELPPAIVARYVQHVLRYCQRSLGLVLGLMGGLGLMAGSVGYARSSGVELASPHNIWGLTGILLLSSVGYRAWLLDTLGYDDAR